MILPLKVSHNIPGYPKKEGWARIVDSNGTAVTDAFLKWSNVLLLHRIVSSVNRLGSMSIEAIESDAFADFLKEGGWVE